MTAVTVKNSLAHSRTISSVISFTSPTCFTDGKAALQPDEREGFSLLRQI